MSDTLRLAPQLAKKHDEHVYTFYRAMDRGELPYLEIAGHRFVTDSAAERFLQTYRQRVRAVAAAAD